VQQLVHDWFRALDIHAPVNETQRFLLAQHLDLIDFLDGQTAALQV